MKPAVINKNLTEIQEAKIINRAFQALSQAQTNMFLPTVLFDKQETIDSILKAKKELRKVVA
jgi:uncharacterized protein YydD (DUF2326 family)